MRLDGSIVRYQTRTFGESKTKNEIIFDDDPKKTATVVKQPIHLTNLVSQRQLPDKLHSKAKVIL